MPRTMRRKHSFTNSSLRMKREYLRGGAVCTAEEEQLQENSEKVHMEIFFMAHTMDWKGRNS